MPRRRGSYPNQTPDSRRTLYFVPRRYGRDLLMVMGAGPRAASVTLVGIVGSRARARTPEAAGITCLRYAPAAGGGGNKCRAGLSLRPIDRPRLRDIRPRVPPITFADGPTQREVEEEKSESRPASVLRAPARIRVTATAGGGRGKTRHATRVVPDRESRSRYARASIR